MAHDQALAQAVCHGGLLNPASPGTQQVDGPDFDSRNRRYVSFEERTWGGISPLNVNDAKSRVKCSSGASAADHAIMN
jgi:hypothetical protein